MSETARECQTIDCVRDRAINSPYCPQCHLRIREDYTKIGVVHLMACAGLKKQEQTHLRNMVICYIDDCINAKQGAKNDR